MTWDGTATSGFLWPTVADFQATQDLFVNRSVELKSIDLYTDETSTNKLNITVYPNYAMNAALAIHLLSVDIDGSGGERLYVEVDDLVVSQTAPDYRVVVLEAEVAPTNTKIITMVTYWRVA